MRIIPFLFPALLFCASLAAGETPAERPADHVVLISIDGLRPEFYLEQRWPAPMLRQLMARGGYAEGVQGVFPTVTYPSHTTIVTGVRPDRHGIHYNSPFEPEGQAGRWYWEEELIRVPTLWDLARQAGLETASLGWPVTVGAPIDRNIPEVWSLDRSAEPLAATRAVDTPADLLEEIEREATGRLHGKNFTIDHLTRDDRVGAAAAYLLETYRPNLLLVHIIGTDHFQHEDGRESPRVELSVAAADRAVAQIYEAAERAGILERTAFIVTGDHGHIDLHTRLAPNVWLAEAGLRGTEPDRGQWRATFHTTGAAAFLHLADPADHEAVAKVQEILADLPRGIRKLFHVLDREDLAKIGASPDAALALALEPGVHVTSSATGPEVREADGATHGYLPHHQQMLTGLIASGAGLRAGAAAAKLYLEDIAPLVAELLGLEMNDIDGVAPLGFLAREEP